MGKAEPTTLNKESLMQVFSCEFCEISENTFFTEHLRTTASEKKIENNTDESDFSEIRY